MNKPISYLLAKLVKEKGLFPHSDNKADWKDLYCRMAYDEKGIIYKAAMPRISNYNHYLAPTIADVTMWLYEKHDIWIVVFPTEENWTFDIFNKIECVKSESFINSPTEAYEKAIEYTLTKLI